MRTEYLPRNKKLNPLSRCLRRNMTKQETHLWYDCLRQLPYPFNRQRIIGQYIVDFYCDKLRLVIELDGSQHYEAKVAARDKKRTQYLESLGLAVLRFTNRDIDRNFDGVCVMIDAFIERHSDQSSVTLGKGSF